MAARMRKATSSHRPSTSHLRCPRPTIFIASVRGMTDKLNGIKVCPRVQEGSADVLHLERHSEEERRADFVAAIFGWRKVGWIFAQSNREREFILSVAEVCQIAAIQAELGEQAVTGVASMSQQGDVHFEAFQANTAIRASKFPYSEGVHHNGFCGAFEGFMPQRDVVLALD